MELQCKLNEIGTVKEQILEQRIELRAATGSGALQGSSTAGGCQLCTEVELSKFDLLSFGAELDNGGVSYAGLPPPPPEKLCIAARGSGGGATLGGGLLDA